MVLTAANTTAFFENANQMGLSNRTRVDSLQAEGISEVIDMAEWEDDDWDQWYENCKRPPRIQDPAGQPGTLINQVPFAVPVKSLKRLKVMSELVRYYVATDRALTPANIKWNDVGKNFEIQRKALDTKSKEDTPTVPKMTQKMKIPKWNDNFKVHCSKRFGARGCTLAYLLRPNSAVDAAAPDLLPNQPYSSCGSIEAEMTERLSHSHALYPIDNATLYAELEEALRGTSYEASIKPFEKRRDGRGAYLALIAQHAGKDKWVAIIDEAEKYINSKKWDGTTSFTLQSHIERCRSAFVELETASQHVAHQLPNARTRVQKLLDSIEDCTDSKVAARHAAISDESNGMSEDFEKAAAYLLPVCPVAKRIGNKRKSAQISGVGGDLVPRGPKTGVEIRYFTPPEFRKLSDAERNELLELRPSGKNKGKAKRGDGKQPHANHTKGKWTKKEERKVAALFKKEKAKWEKEHKEDKSDIREIAEVLASLKSGKDSKKANASGAKATADSDGEDDSMAAAMKINSIIKKRRGSSN